MPYNVLRDDSLVVAWQPVNLLLMLWRSNYVISLIQTLFAASAATCGR